MLKQANLKKAIEPLYIPYPNSYSGEKSGSDEDEFFGLTTTPRMLTEGEIYTATKFIEKLPYLQGLELTGCVMVANDARKLPSSNGGLDVLEKQNQLASTAYFGSTRRTARERQLILLETISSEQIESFNALTKQQVTAAPPKETTPKKTSTKEKETTKDREEKEQAPKASRRNNKGKSVEPAEGEKTSEQSN